MNPSVPRRVLVVASLTEGTGNQATATRIAEHLSSDPTLAVQLVDARRFASSAQFEAETRALQPFAFLGVHLLRAGRLCLDLPASARVVLVAGGTDLNENVKQTEKLAEMRAAVARAQQLVFFTPQMQQLFCAHFGVSSRASQAVIWPAVAPRPEAWAEEAAVEREWLESGFWLLPAGIRDVKCPELLVEAAEERGREHLLICGPVLSESCMARLLLALRGKKMSHYIGRLESGQVWHLMAHRKCFATVNCSESEGLANAILESLALGCPVLARNIPGNAAVIVEGENGVLFEDANDFLKKADAIYRIDRSRVKPLNSPDTERLQYLELFKM